MANTGNSTDSSTTTNDTFVTLSEKYSKVPLAALRQKGRLILSQLLNPIKILPSEDGSYPRDWRGVAHLAGLQSIHGPTISTNHDPMGKVLQLWCTGANDGSSSQITSEIQTPNFDNLLKFLGIIDRWDVSDDISESLFEDANIYETSKIQQQQQQKPIVENKIIPNTTLVEKEIHDSNFDSSHILTRDDVIRAQKGLPPQQYDAFVLFADEDIDFAAELIERLEDDSSNYNFKLCAKDRDLIGGISFEHEAIMRLISERCNKLIVIVTAAFLQSSANKFLFNFAQALQIDKRKLKIIPCLYENCNLPPQLSLLFFLKYHRSGKLFNFWDKLSYSIRNTSAGVPPIASNNSSVTITEVETSSIQKQKKTQQLALLPAPQTENNNLPQKMPRNKKSKAINANESHSDPKIRSSLSMIQLSSINGEELSSKDETCSALIKNSQFENSNSLINIPGIATISDIEPLTSASSLTLQSNNSSSSRNKTKWYKRLLKSTSSSRTVSETDIEIAESSTSLSSVPTKTKKKWKLRLVSS